MSAPTPIWVHLSDRERAEAMTIGALRWLHNRRAGRVQKDANAEATQEMQYWRDSWGSVAERVVAKHLNRYWLAAYAYQRGAADQIGRAHV